MIPTREGDDKMTTKGWPIACSLVALTLVVANSPLRGEDETKQIIADLQAKAAAVKSYRADTTTTIQMMGKKMSMPGNIVFKKPKKSRSETVMDMGAVKMQQIHVSDGKTAWMYQPKMKMVTRIDLEKVAAETKKEPAGQETTDICKPLQCLQRESISHVRTEEIEGSKVCVFQGLPGKSGFQKMPFNLAKMEMWVGADDGVMRKMIMFNDEGNEVMSQSYTNIQLNIEVADSQFEFTPPEGVQVLNMTEGTIAMIKEMKGEPE
jgi:outer membrane lipoprotein-sorting protein